MFKCDQVGRQKAFMKREKATMVISERGPRGKEFFVESVSDPSLCEWMPADTMPVMCQSILGLIFSFFLQPLALL